MSRRKKSVKRGILPDRKCSPGVVRTTNVGRICTPGYSGSVRNVSQATKNAVYREYGIGAHSSGHHQRFVTGQGVGPADRHRQRKPAGDGVLAAVVTPRM